MFNIIKRKHGSLAVAQTEDHTCRFDEKKMIKTDPEMKDSAGTAAVDISHGHSFISTVTFYKVTGRKLSTGHAEAL